ncbi:MAG: hypothetical protein ABFC31_09345 [Clostridiaceae bacterium]
MISGQNNKLIGLTPLNEALESICDNGAVYSLSYAAPPHFLLNLGPGDGQSTVARHIARVYQQAKIRRFGGLDAYLEFSLDGTMVQMKRVFGDIKSCAVFTNEYEGIVALDISALAAHINEAQTEYFLREIRKTSSFATCVFFAVSGTQRSVARLTAKLCEVVENVQTITVMPYTRRELAAIIEEKINARGIEIEEPSAFRERLAAQLAEGEIHTAKQAVSLAEKIMQHVRLEGATAAIGRKEMETAFSCDVEWEGCVNR